MSEGSAREHGVRVHATLALVAVFFSLNYILGKIALADFEPRAFAWLRVTGSALLLLPLRDRSAPLPLFTKQYFRPMILFSLLGVVLNQTLFITGLSLTTAHEAAILITTIPIFTHLGAIATRRERATLARFAGIGIAGAGALTVILSRGVEGQDGSVIGDLFVLMNCACYGLYLVASKPVMAHLSSRAVVSSMFFAATVLMLPLSADALVRQDWHGIPTRAWLALAGVVIGPTVAAYLLNAWALARAESSVVAIYSYAQPLVASILAAVFLAERIAPSAVVAAVLIIAGVLLASRHAPQEKTEEERDVALP